MIKVGLNHIVAWLTIAAVALSACGGEAPAATPQATESPAPSVQPTKSATATAAIAETPSLAMSSATSPVNTQAPPDISSVNASPTVTVAIDQVTLTDAVEKTKNAVSYRVELTMSGNGIFSLDQSTPVPGAAAVEVPLLGLRGEVNGKDDHYLLQGILAAFLGVDPMKGFESMTVGGKAYIHGPVSMLGAMEDKWYALPPDKAQAAQPSVEPVSILESLESAGLTPQDFRLNRTENLDNLTCAIYSGDKDIATKIFQASSGSSSSNITVTAATLQYWVCSDGYFHQMRLVIDGKLADKPDQIGTYTVILHLSDIGTNIVIQAPANAELLTTPTPTASDETPTMESEGTSVIPSSTPQATQSVSATGTPVATKPVPDSRYCHPNDHIAFRYTWHMCCAVLNRFTEDNADNESSTARPDVCSIQSRWQTARKCYQLPGWHFGVMECQHGRAIA